MQSAHNMNFNMSQSFLMVQPIDMLSNLNPSTNKRQLSQSSATTVLDMDDTILIEESSTVNDIYISLRREVFKGKLPVIEKMPPRRGDTDDDIPHASQVTVSCNSLEFRDAITNEVFMRTSLEKARLHLRKISEIFTEQNHIRSDS
jgi:hypothetical protein